MRQQEEDGFWEGNGHAGKEVYFCILGKISAVQLKLCQVRSQVRHLDLPPIEISGLYRIHRFESSQETTLSFKS